LTARVPREATKGMHNQYQYQSVPTDGKEAETHAIQEDEVSSSCACCPPESALDEPDCITNLVVILILAGVVVAFALSWLIGLLTLMALMPACVMMWICYFNAPHHRASVNVNLVSRNFALGVLGALPVALIELFLLWIYEDMTNVKLSDLNGDGSKKLLKHPVALIWVSAFVLSFIVAGFCEESLKYWLVKRRGDEIDNPHGIVVLGLAGALGFASLENLLYVYAGGIETAISRALVSVPMHGLTGCIIGAYVAYDRFVKESQEPSFGFLRIIRYPVLLHGTFDFALVILVLYGIANQGLYRLIPLIICPLVVLTAYVLYHRLSSLYQPVQETFVHNRFGLLPTDMEDDTRQMEPWRPETVGDP